MKKIHTLLFFLFFQFVWSQENNKLEINWIDEKYFITENQSIYLPHFKEASFIYNESNKTIVLLEKIKTNFLIDENSLVLSDVVFESIDNAKLENIDKRLLSNSLNAKIENATSREENYALLSINPIIKDGLGFKRVKSFKFSFAPSNATVSTLRNINAVSNSVLKNGVWKRFYVEKSGVYAISKTFLTELGFNVNVDPRTIKIYGNGGRMLPLQNSVSYPLDLTENAIQFIGENDGVFNDGDYILFYAEGLDNYSSENDTNSNLYADKSYYYVTSSSSSSKRITAMSESLQPVDRIYTDYNFYQYHEIDKTNIAHLGRKWYGEAFNITSSQTFNFEIPNLITSTPVSIKVPVAASAAVNTSMQIKANGIDIGSVSLAASNSYVLGTENTLNTTFNATNSNILIELIYNNNGVPTAIGYLDYIALSGKSSLTGYGRQFRFQENDVESSIGTCEYQISNASGINQVWDITDIYNVTAKENNGNSLFTFKAYMGIASKYINVVNTDIYTPLKEANTSVYNQDIKGTVFLNKQNIFEDIDYLIITPSFLSNQAEKLAEFHRTNSNLNVKVVDLESIYQEFSSGKQDIGAIRNFVKYVYSNASIPVKKVKYLCLFGDASFDFKNRIKNNTNVVPIFQALYSFSLSSSFVSDDYFGLMDPNEGNMNAPLGLDIAVGRMLVNNPTQADQMVNKVLEYYDKKSYARWRNNLVFVSDDTDKPSDATLQSDLDFLANTITTQKPFFNAKKIHLDSYVQETTSGGQKYPKAKEELINSIEQGVLVFNYFGHGGEDGLAGERIFETRDALNLYNKYKYPLFITVTCEFTRFDDPFRPTAGEQTYWNPTGGAVSMVTTTRQIGQSTGEIFNINLASKLFSYGSNTYTSVAEAVRQTKVMSASSGNNVVFYIGDPALMLAIPKPKVNLTKINGIPLSNNPSTIQALSYATLTGEITDEFNNPITTYNGDLAVSVFDKEITRNTLNNDGLAGVMTFTTLGETIFRGNASITNGQFEFGFVVPRDIKIPEGNGRVSFYAKTDNPLQNQTGYDSTIKIGGLDTNAVADTTPPRVRIYMNDELFVSGGITNQSPLFLAFMEDEHGINTASGIGHDIIAYLDGDETKPYVLNDYYETELNNYTKGKLKYPFRNLSIGLHTLTFKAWDVYNNLITAELQFIVVGDETLSLSNVLNYPNPFVNYTEFWFTHNKPYEPLEVQVQIFTITGKVVWTKNQTITTTGFTSRDITWDGKDDFGDKIGKGVYVYKLTVKSLLTDKKSEKFEKLVIL